MKNSKIFRGGVVETTNSGEWELIVDHTVEENCQSVMFTEDINGNIFNLRKALVYIEVEPNIDDAIESYASIGVSFGKIGNTYATSFNIGHAPSSTENKIISYGIYEKIGDVVYNTQAMSSFNRTNVTNLLVNKTGYTELRMDNNKKVSTMEMLRLSTGTASFGKGSVIKMYGIREVTS